MCPLSQAEITCPRISFPVWFWDIDGHMRNSWMWRHLQVYVWKIGVGIRSCSLCHWSAGSPGSVRGTAWPTAPPSVAPSLGPCASVTPWQRDQLLQQGHPVPRLELLRAKAGSPCEVQLSRWVPVCPASWPHSYFLPNYHCHWHRGTLGSTQDAKKAAWHAHGCTQSTPVTECFIPRHSQSSTPLVHSWLIRTIHLWKTLGLFNAITRDSYMFIPMMLTDRGVKRLATWLYSPLASSVKWGACSTLGF